MAKMQSAWSERMNRHRLHIWASALWSAGIFIIVLPVIIFDACYDGVFFLRGWVFFRMAELLLNPNSREIFGNCVQTFFFVLPENVWNFLNENSGKVVFLIATFFFFSEEAIGLFIGKHFSKFLPIRCCLISEMMRATIEKYHFFSEIPRIWDRKTSPKNRFGEKYNWYKYRGWRIPWPRYTTRIVKKKMAYFFFPSFMGQRSPVIQKPFQPKNGIPLS